MRFLGLATFNAVFVWLCLPPRTISIFMHHLQLRCKVSDTGAPNLPSTSVILTVFAVLRDTLRRYQLHPAPENAARIDSCETL